MLKADFSVKPISAGRFGDAIRIDTKMRTQLMDEFTATYSPEDNKLRLYAANRLDDELYEKIKRAGFRWAPKQDLFFRHWSPNAEDLLLTLVDDIDDEGTSAADRAAQRAQRFEDYSAKRARESDQQAAHARKMSDMIPFGQPILVGHHSERGDRARRKRIGNAWDKAGKLWQTSEYWETRAKGVIASSSYKDRSDVRARRIKKLEAEKRKHTRELERGELLVTLWSSEKLTHDKAVTIANRLDHASFSFTLAEYPRDFATYEGPRSLWSALDEGIIDYARARELTLPAKHRAIAYYQRYIDHNARRLTYEKAILEAQGASDLLKPRPRPKQPPLLNYRQPEGFEIENIYHAGEFSHYPQVEMTKAEYAKIGKDYKATRHYQGHKVRTAMRNHSLVVVFLTDSKVHAKPVVGVAA